MLFIYKKYSLKKIQNKKKIEKNLRKSSLA